MDPEAADIQMRQLSQDFGQIMAESTVLIFFPLFVPFWYVPKHEDLDLSVFWHFFHSDVLGPPLFKRWLAMTSGTYFSGMSPQVIHPLGNNIPWRVPVSPLLAIRGGVCQTPCLLTQKGNVKILWRYSTSQS